MGEQPTRRGKGPCVGLREGRAGEGARRTAGGAGEGVGATGAEGTWTPPERREQNGRRGAGRERAGTATEWGKGEKGREDAGSGCGAPGWEGAGRGGRCGHLGLQRPCLRGGAAEG